MPKKAYIGELVLNDDYADRKDELERIHWGIRDTLISRRVQLTENPDEAYLVIIFVTRCFLPRCFNLLSRIQRRGACKHAIIVCDKSHLSADEFDLRRLLVLAMGCRDSTVGPRDDDLFKDCDPHLQDQLPPYISKMLASLVGSFWMLPNGEYHPPTLTDSDSVVQAVASCTLKFVNNLDIDLHKAIGMEPDVFKITDLISKNADRKTTRFVVISGCRQTHDVSTITKYLAMEQMLGYDALVYRENWPDEFPPDFGEQLIVETYKLDYATDIHQEYLYFAEHFGRDFKFLLVLDGVSSINQLKEIRKLGALLFNDQFPGSLIMLSTDIDTFKEFGSYFQSHDSVFLGYVDGAAIADQSASIENVADSGRPFCIELNALQLGEIIAMADERTSGIPYSIGVMLLNYY